MTADIHQFPHPEDRIDVSACIRRDEEAVQAGMIMYAQILHAFVAKFPPGFFHAAHDIEGTHIGWCVHQNSNNGLGCRRPSLIEVIDHVLAEHPEGGNCGE